MAAIAAPCTPLKFAKTAETVALNGADRSRFGQTAQAVQLQLKLAASVNPGRAGFE